MKTLILKEHMEQVGDADCEIKKRNDFYYVYWRDGLIERRDIYFIFGCRPLLENAMQRYLGDTKWIQVKGHIE